MRVTAFWESRCWAVRAIDAWFACGAGNGGWDFDGKAMGWDMIMDIGHDMC